MKYNFLSLLILLFTVSCGPNTGAYVCTPCDLPCDELQFSENGVCPHCKMDLIKKSELISIKELVLNEINIQNGAGSILIEGGASKEKTIIVHYYKPNNLKPQSPIVMVLPGAGRNGDEYRNAWIEKADEYGALVIALEYSESNYPQFWSYNLAGMLTDVEINEERTAMTGFKISQLPEEWIFNDFDRIFDLVKNSLDLKVDTYDIFGHSAGGQILHRMAIFRPSSKANRILASNSGWYTLPTNKESFPYGLKESAVSTENVDFSNKLVLFLGGLDDANETRGSLRRTEEADRQGLHRLARWTYFYNESKRIAAEMNAEFNWSLEIVPGIGHDYTGMSRAAADYLYQSGE